MSKPFYFRQKEHGTIVDVLFPKATESPEIAAFKKGKIAQICPEMHANEMQAPYNKHHKVSSHIKGRQNNDSFRHEVI